MSDIGAPSRPHSLRRSAVAVTVAALLGGLLSAVGPSPADAANPSEFDPGYIISDQLFFDGAAMTEQQIQAFLDSKVPSCGNSLCLTVYRQNTDDRSATSRCTAYDGRADESAARIIYKVQVACGISAKVILVTLQKEQGLITATAPTSSRLRIAMGYGCPDTSACDSLYYGFFNQVYSAASQFKRYGTGSFTWYPVGEVSEIRYHPSGSCGTRSVRIENRATAALYYYTPYTPNSAALGNLYGTGDSCSSYGNRNFWAYYSDWFGSPVGVLSSDVVKERAAGPDRYATSVAVSQSAYPDSSAVSTVFVASGENFPDGLSAAPAAALAGAPLLLTKKGSLPAEIRDEILRLAPEQIVVVGGPPAVSTKVEAALAAIAPVIRLAGDDRFATSRAIAEYAFPDGADDVFIAIGENFPDALAASAVSGHLGMPVVLVPRGAGSADRATLDLVAGLGATRVIAAGSTTVIRSSYLTSFESGAGVTDLLRLGGATRYQTAAVINEFAYSEVTLSYLASGENFPDALSAAAVAGAQGAGLHLSPGNCLTAASVAHLTSAGVEKLIFVGSSAVLSKSAWNYTPC